MSGGESAFEVVSENGWTLIQKTKGGARSLWIDPWERTAAESLRKRGLLDRGEEEYDSLYELSERGRLSAWEVK